MTDELSELDFALKIEGIVNSPAILTAKQMREKASQKTDFLIDRAIPDKAITLLMGPPGGGKSWYAYQLEICVARGIPFLGYPPCKPGRVLELNFDNPTPESARRHCLLGMSDDDPIFFHTYSDGVEMLRLPDKASEVKGIVNHIKPKLIVVDSFRQCHDSDENSSKEMAVVMRMLKELTTLNSGCAVLALHHTTKGVTSATMSAARGSGEIYGSADCTMLVGPLKDSTIIPPFAEASTIAYDKTRPWRQRREEKHLAYAYVDGYNGPVKDDPDFVNVVRLDGYDVDSLT